MTLFPDALEHHQSGRLKEAEQLYRQILSENSQHADSLHLLGMIYKQYGHYEEAARLIERAISANSLPALYYSNLGTVFEAQGDLAQAAAKYKQALHIDPNYAQAHYNLAGVLVKQTRLEDAIAHYGEAARLDPNSPPIHNNFGFALDQQGRTEEAIQHYQSALALNGNYAEAHSNLGNALQSLDRSQEAAECYLRALYLKPCDAAAYCNLGNAFKAQNRLEDALACYEQALRFDPEYHLARFSKALIQLSRENFAAGWDGYEARWSVSSTTELNFQRRQEPAYVQALWNGEPLDSGRLLIWREQGIGDEIMFAGLIPDLLSAGANCVVECDERLMPLLARSFPTVECWSDAKPEKLHGKGVAAHLPIGSLPRFLRPDAKAFGFTTSPYLKADETMRDHFRAGYSRGQRLIGLAWFTQHPGTRRRRLARSVDLACSRPLFEAPAVSWVSLQYGDFDALQSEASEANAPVLIDRSVDQFADLDRFAAQIAAMDLVITIDNATAHLAGALGVPVWILLPFAPDWRWFQERADSPWYPTARLFRQPRPGDWKSVIEHVRRALQDEV